MNTVISPRRKGVILNLSANKKLAASVAKKAKLPLGEVKINHFMDGEIFIDVKASVRNKEIFIIQSTSKPSSKHLMEVFLTVDAIKRASAKEITVVMPYYGYSRQDRRGKGGQPISASLIARLLEKAGVDRVITFDLHASQIEGFFNIPVDNLKAGGILFNEFKKVYKGKMSDIVVVSPDHGGVTRAREFALKLKANIAIIDKRRTRANVSESMFILGDVKGKNAVIVDDMVDTGGTIKIAVERLYKEGAKKVYVVATHPILSGTEEEPEYAINRLKESNITAFITTNSIEKSLPHSSLIKVADLSRPLADVINAHLNGESITKYFIKKYSIQL